MRSAMGSKLFWIGLFTGILLFLSVSVANALKEGWVNVNGTVSYKGAPVCAMVLINGQYTFTCQTGDAFGNYELTVPRDSNGEVTIQAFVSGKAPYRLTMEPSDQDMDIAMQAARPDSQSVTVTTMVATDASTPANRTRITGTVDHDVTPLCAMVLANGQYMFSCGANAGIYDLAVPLDSNGQVTLYVFVSGFQPYKRVFYP